MPKLALLLVFLFSFGMAKDVKTLKDVQWMSFDKGLQAASQNGKYGFISVYTDWCGYCKKLDATTLKAKSVVDELTKNFVSIRFNAESAESVTWKGKKTNFRELADQLGVVGFPTLLFLNPKGEIIGSFPSFAEADLMMKLLTYISSGAREKNVSFDDYLKKAS